MKYLTAALVIASLSIALYAARQGGIDKGKAECIEKQAEAVWNEAHKKANRPRTDDDVLKRLRNWADRTRAEEQAI